jgi:hypothetical protein
MQFAGAVLQRAHPTPLLYGLSAPIGSSGSLRASMFPKIHYLTGHVSWMTALGIVGGTRALGFGSLNTVGRVTGPPGEQSYFPYPKFGLWPTMS